MVRLIRLKNGMEILANVTEDGDKLELRNPVQVAMTQQGAAMVPLLMLAKCTSVEIPTSEVLWNVEPNDEVANAYNQQFGSGIVTAPAGALDQIPRNPLVDGV